MAFRSAIEPMRYPMETSDQVATDQMLSTLQQIFPELKERNLNLIICGYDFCPYSKMALDELQKQLAGSNAKFFKNHTVFISFSSRSEPELLRFRKETGYNGSMPCIFVRTKTGKLVHIGGATDFVAKVNQL